MWPFNIFKKKASHPSPVKHIESVANNDNPKDTQHVIAKTSENNSNAVMSKAVLSMGGKYSDNILWRIENDTLIISVDGPMNSSSSKAGTVAQPWMYQHRKNPVVRHVVIEEGITSIWTGAFSNHPSLETVVIADSVSSIEESAFWGCTALKTVTLPPFIQTIESGAFSGCTSLEWVTIPNTVAYVGRNAFEGTPFLEGLQEKTEIVLFGACVYRYYGTEASVNIPEGAKTIAPWAFAGCKQLITVNIPEGVVAIHSGAFMDCEALQSVTIPDSVKELGYAAFQNCKSLSNVRINLDTTTFYPSTFENTPWHENLPNSITFDHTLIAAPHKAKHFVVPKDVKTIANGALRNRPFLELEIPQSVERLDEFCCSSCKQLKILRLPERLHMFPPHICPIISCPKVETVYYGKGDSISVDGIDSLGRAGENAIWIKQNTGIVSIIGSGTIDLDMIIDVSEEEYSDFGSYLVFSYVWGCADVEIAESVMLSEPLAHTLPTESMQEEYKHWNVESKTYYFSVRHQNNSHLTGNDTQ